jgi:RimJ/RimL family protein N-acetyltransferase
MRIMPMQIPPWLWFRAAAEPVRPSLCGRGQGRRFVAAVLDFARQQFSPPALRSTVAAFNARALRVWESAGFVRVQTFPSAADGIPFVVLLHPPPALPEAG